MRMADIFTLGIEDSEKENLKRSMLEDNIHRGKILAKVVIGFEVILSVIDVSASILKVDNRFHFSNYFLMYMLMILLNIAFCFMVSRVGDLSNKPISYLNRLENSLVVYITLVMLWGSIISLMDQKLYGQLMAYMVNMIACSVFYYLDNKKVLIPFSISILALFLGLPLFQSSSDILIGHYVNLTVFSFLFWLTSRILYLNYCNDFKNRSLINKSNILLASEIEQNRIINMKLEEANEQLRELALKDELTGIPNRRGLNNYIDFIYEYSLDKGSLISIIMMDIDNFKQYNDNYGHNAGDKVLISIADQINSVVRHSKHFIARFGGEEFIYVAIHTNEKQIAVIAETIRKKIEELKITHEYSQGGKYVSISLGTSTVRVYKRENILQCIEFADRALYRAKTNGRNCVASMDIADIDEQIAID
jgi:diguanylate cyclase (GGDEF) domain